MLLPDAGTGLDDGSQTSKHATNDGRAYTVREIRNLAEVPAKVSFRPTQVGVQLG
jgi:hypothetical protein